MQHITIHRKKRKTLLMQSAFKELGTIKRKRKNQLNNLILFAKKNKRKRNSIKVQKEMMKIIRTEQIGYCKKIP